MEQEQYVFYINTICEALQLVKGPRNEDYNSGGIGLRDYWEVNGLMAPVQMVDMKLKRIRSLIGTFPDDEKGRKCPPTIAAYAKLLESCVDLINYAAFISCEGASLYNELVEGSGDEVVFRNAGKATQLSEAIKTWENNDNA